MALYNEIKINTLNRTNIEFNTQTNYNRSITTTITNNTLKLKPTTKNKECSHHLMEALFRVIKR